MVVRGECVVCAWLVQAWWCGVQRTETPSAKSLQEPPFLSLGNAMLLTRRHSVAVLPYNGSGGVEAHVVQPGLLATIWRWFVIAHMLGGYVNPRCSPYWSRRSVLPLLVGGTLSGWRCGGY